MFITLNRSLVTVGIQCVLCKAEFICKHINHYTYIKHKQYLFQIWYLHFGGNKIMSDFYFIYVLCLMFLVHAQAE